ncbi:MAG: HAD family hydrolase [Ktedonobacteraceae bacterium]
MLEKPLPTIRTRAMRCLLFDFGDTLWSRRDLEQWRRMENASNTRAAALLRALTASDHWPDLTDEALGRCLHKAIDERMNWLIHHQPYAQPNGGMVAAEVLHRWKIADIDQAQGAAIFEALRVRIPQSRPLFADVLPTLAELRRRGFLLGAVSNRHWGGQIFQEDLETLGILQFIDPCHIAISVDLGIRKPHPAIFHRVLHDLHVPSAQAAMVGDSLLSDITGARRIGLFTIWKPKPGMREQASALLAGRSVSAAHPLTGLHVTDDDYILTQARRGEQAPHVGAEPDLVIEQISDLLDIFTKAGEP